MKHSIARKALVLVLIPALTQLILLVGLISLFSEFELYPRRAEQDCVAALDHSSFALAQSRLVHYITGVACGRQVFDGTIGQKYLTDLRQSSKALQTCWRTLSDRRKPLLHPVTILTGYNDPFKAMDAASDAIEAYTLSAERAYLDLQAALRSVQPPGSIKAPVDVFAALAQRGRGEDKALRQSIKTASDHLKSLDDYQDGNAKKASESSQLRIDALRWVQFVALLNLLNLLVSGLLFNRKLAARLAIMLENNERFGKGQKLLPQIGGDDELSDLDQTYHEMARTLSENKAIQRVIIDNAQDLICTLDLQGRIVTVNQAAREILGYKPAQLIGKYMVDLISPEYQTVFSEAILKSVAGQSIAAFEVCAERLQRGSIELLCALHAQNEKSSVFCIFQDISRSKSAVRLQQQVTTLVCDDLQKPIGEMVKFHQELLNEVYGPILKDGERQLKIAQSCTSRMHTLVKDLADSQNLERGELSLQKSVVDVSAIFEHAIDATTALAQAQQIRLLADSEDLKVYCDPDRLVQVLINLIGNAIKFSPPQSTITLSARQSESVTQLAVSDQGRGIPTHLLPRVFERFSQTQMADSKVKGGSGLGLAICKSLVELHQGSIRVTSVVDQGTTFILSLPNPGSAGGQS